MAQIIQEYDGLGFDFSALFTGAANLAKSSAPKLIEASVARRVAKDQAKAASYFAPAPAPVYAPPAPVYAPPAPVYEAPYPQGYAPAVGFNLGQFAKPAAIGVAALVGLAMFKKIQNKDKK